MTSTTYYTHVHAFSILFAVCTTHQPAFWIYGAAVGVDVVGSVGARKVEERHTGIQGAEEWEAWSHPKKGQKDTPFRTFHTLVRVMNAIQSYISTSYDINLFRFRQMKLTNLPGGLKMSHGPSGQPRLNAVSMAPRVRVGKNLKLWLGNQPQN